MEQNEKNDPCEPIKLASQLSQARNELNNIRKALHTARAQHKCDVERLEDLLESAKSLQINSFKHKEKLDVNRSPSKNKNVEKLTEVTFYHMKPIGILKSLHRQKNGTPRQGVVSSFSRAKLTIEKDVYNNPSHSLEGLQEYSHVWLLYVFHQNTSHGSHAKVSPPRLDGSKLGVFSTRSPHRPNPIGLTLAKLDGIQGDSLLLSGIDIIDETPVIDIKPYIPYYDSPSAFKSNKESAIEITESSLTQITPTNSIPSQKEGISHGTQNEGISHGTQKEGISHGTQKEGISHGTQKEAFSSSENYLKDSKRIENIPLLGNAEEIGPVDNGKEVDDTSTQENYLLHPSSENVSFPQWLKCPPSSGLKVIFNPVAEEQIKQFSCDAENPNFRLEYLKSDQELKCAIASVLSEDPRSTYRRQKCPDRLYFFMVDSAHITTCFFGTVVEVLRVCPSDKESPCYKFI